MFQKKSTEGYKPAIDKIKMKTLVHGEKTMLVEFQMEKGALLPRHSHPHEQTGYLVSGSINLTIGKETFTVKPGDSWCIPGDIEHNAAILEDTVAVEVFSPVREDYLPQ
ncbi:MAG: cupin domain-containing protein [Desulfuromusa sp.]|nr:cupin domain-containing protein [Desulfuromusa sp.]